MQRVCPSLAPSSPSILVLRLPGPNPSGIRSPLTCHCNQTALHDEAFLLVTSTLTMQSSHISRDSKPRGHIRASGSRVSRDHSRGGSRIRRHPSPQLSATLKSGQPRRTPLSRPPTSSNDRSSQRPSSRGVEAGFGLSSNDDVLDHVIVAIDVRDKDRVGCACYVASEEKLLCMEEIGGLGSNDIVEKCKHIWAKLRRDSHGLAVKFDLQPTYLLLSSRADSISNATHAQLRQDDSLTHSGKGHSTQFKSVIEPAQMT